MTISRNFSAAILALLATPAIVFAATDDQGSSAIGAWKLNLAESIAPQGSPFRPYTVVVKRADDVLDFAYTSVGENGQPFRFGYAGKADGVVRDLEGGLKGSMTRMPSGNYDAKLWASDGTYENKFCQLLAGGRKQVCMATVTAANGNVVFFKQVLDRQ